MERTLVSLPLPVMVCAWCARYGQPHGAARDRMSGEWRAVSHEQARALHRQSTASHGVCPWCRPRLAAEWDLPPFSPPAATIPASARLAG